MENVSNEVLLDAENENVDPNANIQQLGKEDGVVRDAKENGSNGEIGVKGIKANKLKRKKRQRDEEDIENTRLKEEKYAREVHEQRYKRLMHLLNRSKFYASYLVNKIDSKPKESNRGRKKLKNNDDINENGLLRDKSKKKSTYEYDIREYISNDEKQNIAVNDDKRIHLNKDQIENQLYDESDDDTKESADITLDTPKYFNGELRPYQKEGLRWLKLLYENGLNGILADEMGLGKTIQVIALLCHLIEKKQDGPYLIIAPLSTIPNWKIEFEKFAPKLPVVLLHGPPAERMKAQREINKKKFITGTYKTQPIVLTTFEVPLQEVRFLRSQHWKYIIIDEGHRIKNHQCQLVSILKTLKSMNRLLLTGTPLQNNLAELWSLLNFLLPEIFNDLAVFESWFDPKELQYDEGTKKLLKQEEEKHVLSSLREILKPFMLRRVKAEVCLDLPDKKELIVYAPMSQLQHDLYKAVLTRDIETLRKVNDDDLIITTEDGSRPRRKCTMNSRRMAFLYNEDQDSSSSIDPQESDESTDSENWKNINSPTNSALSFWKQYADVSARNQDFVMHLTLHNTLSMYKKIINHPYLIHCPLAHNGLPKIDDDLIKVSGKTMVLDQMLSKLRSKGHKVLLFSTMTTILDVLEDYLSMRDYQYLRLDGSTSIESRTESIKLFNSNPDIFLFLISTRAGGVGLNLAAADTVIMYDSDWNPQVDIQAMARCHRIGQTRPVVIYKFCTKGTVDEAIMKRAEAKRILEKLVISKKINGPNLQSKETLLEMRRLLESQDCQIAVSKNEVYSEEELEALLDRTDLQNPPEMVKPKDETS